MSNQLEVIAIHNISLAQVLMAHLSEGVWWWKRQHTFYKNISIKLKKYQGNKFLSSIYPCDVPPFMSTSGRQCRFSYAKSGLVKSQNSWTFQPHSKPLFLFIPAVYSWNSAVECNIISQSLIHLHKLCQWRLDWIGINQALGMHSILVP